MRRILIVDDEPAILDAIATLLADEGYPVQTAPNGRVALAMVATSPPDLLITDVMMPGLDGWMLLDRIRMSVPDLPVIVMSAVDRRRTPRPERSASEHTVFLRKPFGIEALLAIVQRLTAS